MKRLSLLFVQLIALTSICFTQTVKIGNQVWMTTNLNVDTFRNGDPIPQAKTEEEWKRAGANKQPAWCYYDNKSSLGEKYGKLYNWYAVSDTRRLAPVGYHIPSDEEWDVLTDYLGGDAGKKMKSISGWNSYTSEGSKTCPKCATWNSEYKSKVACHTCKDTREVPAPKIIYSGNGSNSSRFSALPGGYREFNGAFYGISEDVYWWSSTDSNTSLRRSRESAWGRGLDYYYGSVDRNSYDKTRGLSVRCIKD